MGTPNLQGTWTLDMGLLIRASSPPNLFGFTLAASDCCLEAELELVGICNGCGELRVGGTSGSFLANSLYPSANVPPIVTTCLAYTIGAPTGRTTIPVIDNGDGTYTVLYKWSIPGLSKTVDTDIRLEITELRDCATPPPSPFTKISISTVESFWRGVPGTPLKAQYDNTQPVMTPGADSFFNHATPEWRGCGTL